MPTPEELMAAGGDRSAIAAALMDQQPNPSTDYLKGNYNNYPNTGLSARDFESRFQEPRTGMTPGTQALSDYLYGRTSDYGESETIPRADGQLPLDNGDFGQDNGLSRLGGGRNALFMANPYYSAQPDDADLMQDTAQTQSIADIRGGNATTNYPYDDTLIGGRSAGAGFSDPGYTGYYGSFDPYSTSSGLGTSDPYGRNQPPNYATVPTQQTNYDQYPDYQQVGRGGYAGYGGNARSFPLDPYDQGSTDTITRDYDLRSQPTPQQMARTNEFPSRRGDPLEPIPPQEPFDPPPDPGQEPEPQQRGDPSARFTVRSQIPDAEYPDEVPPPDVSPEVSPSRVAQQPSRGGGVPDDYYSQPAGGPYTSGGEAGYTSLDFQLPDRIGYGQQAVTALPYNDDLHGAYARADANDYSAAARRGTPGVNYAAQIAAILAAQGRGV